MPKYYVPLVMVIEAPDCEAAQSQADNLKTLLCRVDFPQLDGFVEIDNLEPIEVPEDWYDLDDLHVTYDGETFSLTTEAP